ncbi:MAG: alanine--tRNA ligase [Ornithinimicrobium sp.]
METAEIRRRWLAYFESNGHAVVPSASLISPDPTTLFTIAGMVPFIPYLTGQQTPPWPRATSVQKCVRTLDIEEVGKTTRHGTFFQMNGNFSFGDYFKEGAIRHAWEFITSSQDIGGLGFDPDTVWVTVLEGDTEASDLWQQVAGLPPERIQERGRADNYWHTGTPGPGGPCSEIYIDRGPEYGPDGGPIVDEDRFLEIWNLVFMQEELSEVRSKTDFDVVGELPSKNIDTGMGLERVAYLLQGVDNLYEIDEVYPVIAAAEDLSGRTYGVNEADDVLLRVVADHVRSGLMLISDGVTPSNEGRGYVLRRLLRRAVRSMRQLGVPGPCLPTLLPVSRDVMAASYPELLQQWSSISAVAYGEEQAFARTLSSGIVMLESAVKRAKRDGGSRLGGDEAFTLHDTYGFPIDLTLEMAAEQGITVDEAGFRNLMAGQRERAKADARAKKSSHGDIGVYRGIADELGQRVQFTGYDETRSEGRIAGVVRGGISVPAAHAGDDVEVVLDRTPFYAEGGGQLADAGTINLGGGGVIEVLDVQTPVSGLIVHRAKVVSGEVVPGEPAESWVDIERRRAISRAHTATHMVHKAIREALGESATQAGSENAPGRFRFDFNANEAVPPSVLIDVEARVNALLMDDLPVRAEVMTQQQAIDTGAMALFGEKYGDEVRVVSVGDWASELCGGTHAQRSGQLGVVKLMSEASIGAGVRRVEALVGSDAYRFLAREHAIVGQLSDVLKTRAEDLPERIESILVRLRDAEREIAASRAKAVVSAAPALAQSAVDIAGVTYVGHHAGPGIDGDDVRRLVGDVRARLGQDRPSIVAVTAIANERPIVVVATNELARQAGLRAGDLVKVASAELGGGGGGKPDMAQGGGSAPDKTGAALHAVERSLGERQAVPR